MNTIKGIGVSPGISIGRARVLQAAKAEPIGQLLSGEADKAREIALYREAVNAAIKEVKAVSGNTDLDLLEVHLELLADPQMESEVTEKISRENKTAHDALIEVTTEIAGLFAQMPDEYMRERSADVRDAGNRILKHLRTLSQGAAPAQSPTPGSRIAHTFEPGTILIAEDLSPSDMILLDTTHVVGFATRSGGKTSHTAIVARSRGIPAIVGCGEGLTVVSDNDVLLLDGESGQLLVDPDREVVNGYAGKLQSMTDRSIRTRLLKNKAAVTADGTRIHLLANISGEKDVKSMVDHGGEGIGLLRTELFFMSRPAFPSEEEQFHFYKDIVLRSKGKPVTIRTLDIGGDKPLPYFPLSPEDNPFLGYRAIRISLDRTDIFRTQLRAILRASAFGPVRVLYPMISGVQEVRAANGLLDEIKEELSRGLDAKGASGAPIAFDEQIQTGVMIETPAAAMIADILAKESDFFSIGTNDLCQYTLAVDRLNPKIKDLYEPFHPAVLRLIRHVIEQAHARGIPVGMCGEMASDPLATLLLLGLGLDEFSVNAPAIPSIKDVIISSSISRARTIARLVLEMDQSESILSYLQEVNQ